MTLIETLAVVAIIAVLASLTFPVFAQAKERGNQTSCLSTLRQSHLAIKLYQAEYDGKDVGSIAEMGLPQHGRLFSVDKALFRPGLCRRVPSERIPRTSIYPYIYVPEDRPSPEDSPWRHDIARHGDGTILILDVNHNLSSEPLQSRFFAHTGLAITYGGQALNRTAKGNPDDLRWWYAPEGI